MFIYKITETSLKGWRCYGVKYQKIEDATDIHALTKALFLLQKALPDIDCLKFNEYWITPCPIKGDFVMIRLDCNPYDSAYLLSPIELLDLKEFLISQPINKNQNNGE